MKGENNKQRFIFISSLIAIAVVCRLLPHPPNFTPIGAIALFGGAMFDKKIFAFIVPLGAMLLSNMVIGFHSTMWAVFLAFAGIVCIGFLLRGKAKALPIIGAAIGSSVLFFIVTNFAVWLGSLTYPQTIEGLMLCYAAAIPFATNDLFGSFFLNTVMGDLFYTSVLFGAYYLAQAKFPQLARVNS